LEKNKVSWLYFTIIVLNTFFGIQILRAFLSLLVNFYRERPNISLIDVGIYAFTTFAIVFLVGFLYRFLKWKTTLWLIVGGLGVIRFIIQVISWPPLSLALSALGTILWISSFIFFISLIQYRKINLLTVFFPAVIFGISFDSAVHGLSGTWDIIWRSTTAIHLFILLLAVIQLWIIFRISAADLEVIKFRDGSRASFYTLIIILPWILLQLLKFQNLAACMALTRSNLALSLIVILAANIIAFSFTYFFNIIKTRIIITILASIFLIFSFWPDAVGYLYIIQLIFGQIGAVWLLLIVLYKAAGGSAEKAPWKTTSAVATGGILFFILIFIYYASYDISLPFDNWLVPVFIAIFIAICGLVAVILRKRQEKNYRDNSRIKSANTGSIASKNYKPLYLLLCLLIIPIIMFVPTKAPSYVASEEDSVTVMTYNIHQGFNINGYLDLESIAEVIERNGADVVALQEVSRGWVINSSVDNLSWLSDRLEMDYIFMPASDAVWGNAILSRYPVEIIKSGFLPRMGAPLRRSFILAEIKLAENENINILCVHLHHIEDEGCIRESQVESLIEEWGGLERTAIMGDFNAKPDDSEIKMMSDAGLLDSHALIGKGEGLTWVHYKPYRRIDYIWVTEDIEISNLVIPYSIASDHLPIAVDIK
jgi:endonuclease/exonuclease/phosphatase family metal-dependent hydrolase